MEIQISNSAQNDRHPLSESCLLGRQPTLQEDGSQVISIYDGTVSREQLRLSPCADGSVQIENLSYKTSVHVELPACPPLNPRSHDDAPPSLTLSPPIRLSVGRTLIRVDQEAMPTGSGPSEHWQTLAPSMTESGSTGNPLANADQMTPALEWLERLLAVLRAAAGSDRFYSEAARAMVTTIGLDCGMVIMRTDDEWDCVARYSPQGVYGEYSHAVLAAILREKTTIFQHSAEFDQRDSLNRVSGFAAAPIFDRSQREVVGVLYGFRFGVGGQAPIEAHEAHMAQVLASAVASGIARETSDAEASRRQIQFEQFVTPEVAQELQDNPDALRGVEADITVLFADIRNFSKIAERMPAAQLFEFIRDIMDCLAQRVRDRDGTTCSFLGDGLLAMWNAPVRVENHAERACLAALDMIEALPKLNQRWQGVTGTEIGVGVGINTGTAMVGNTGCGFKPQYGPLGDSVNLASRVEGATKKFRVPILITQATEAALPDDFATRRLCRIQVVGRDHPESIYELHGASRNAQWDSRRQAFESALADFEEGNWLRASERAFRLVRTEDGGTDQPALILVSRAVECVQEQPEEFDPVWRLFSK